MADGSVGKRILVVDDEAGMRQMLGMMLSRQGYGVSAAENGQSALKQLRENVIDIVLADVRMPELDGLGLLKEIHDAKIPVTVIMMSAFVELDTAVSALKLGASDYVSKPFKTEEVLVKIRMAEERLRLEKERQQLVQENARLRQAASADTSRANMVGKSVKLAEVFHIIRKVCDYKSTVLLLGESGTGKELAARALHNLSVRRAAPFVPINCGAIPETLLESELFGHVKGAFTDATRTKLGLIEEASGGTLFLDEMGELPLALQVKLLRFLQEDEIRRVGENHGVAVDVRVVAATARNLPEMVRAGTFREDLYYRLNVLQLRIPPLRERKEDIPLLVEHFLRKFSQRLQRPDMQVEREALRRLMDYAWPGNIRELENTIERAMILADGHSIGCDALPEPLHALHVSGDALALTDNLSIKRAVRALECDLISRSLSKTAGNRTHAAQLLEISHRALLYKIKEYKL